MKDTSYGVSATTRRDYKAQLIHYYNKGIGSTSEIAGVMITKELISTIEKRYKELGGILPINQEDIEKERGKGWSQIQ